MWKENSNNEWLKTVTTGFFTLTFILRIDHGLFVLSLINSPENKRILRSTSISQALSESNILINDALS